jgi:hypothetical protein
MKYTSERELLEQVERETKIFILEAWSFLDELMVKSARKEDIEASFEKAQRTVAELKARLSVLEAKLVDPNNNQG